MDGEEVVEIYVSDRETEIAVPIRALAGFGRVYLKRGETKKVEIMLKPEQFSLIDHNYNRIIEPGKFIICAGGCQPGVTPTNEGRVVKTEIELTGKPFLIE
jgi:beta-glucosidase